MILPADKGRASVVLDADTYHDKMKTLIETGLYQLVNKDPTDRLSAPKRTNNSKPRRNHQLPTRNHSTSSPDED